MAEALGVAASGIAVFQVATQVGSSIIKLKQLWDNLQDAPSSIRDLLDQIECLDPALWEADHTFSHANLSPMLWDNSIASRSTTYCRKALNSLAEVVDELAPQINRTGKLRKGVASAKVVLKKEQLKSLERRLQSAVMMLNLAQQSYLVTTWELQSSRSYGDWKFNLRSYRTVPYDSDVFSIVRWGDPKEVQMLFASGQASPHDRDADFGFTLLHFAVSTQNWPMIQYLLSVGASPFEVNTFRMVPMLIMLGHGEDIYSFKDWVHTDAFHKLQHRMPMAQNGITGVTIGKDRRAVAEGLGCSTKESQSEWANLADVVIQNTLDIHHLDITSCYFYNESTPLMTVIRGWVNNLKYRDLNQDILSRAYVHLEPWLLAVRSNGYDLEEYGRRENELLADKELNLPGRCGFRVEQEGSRSFIAFIRLRGYEYGLDPRDWKILWSIPEKNYAADFWRLVEDGPQLVPGAWVEDEDEDEYEYNEGSFTTWRYLEASLSGLNPQEIFLATLYGLEVYGDRGIPATPSLMGLPARP
ncbi:hypothetical protein O1611_g2480 [Lasiodiplodia mahajangana]|uniref:Uncharacterized protein n=1 Tax=Lasiodiplodia mahajangana TaxID=1108764 RepID=A0ACC2JV66_9PEZI|nr:hypothetical protein O1611_g2480 [Lasiodiplodia mahajangana]